MGLHTSRHTRKNSSFSTQDTRIVLLGWEALPDASHLHYATRSSYLRRHRCGSLLRLGTPCPEGSGGHERVHCFCVAQDNRASCRSPEEVPQRDSASRSS